MLLRLGTLAAVLAWLFLAGPAVLAAAERADSGIEVRNGTRTQNLAHLTRTLLSQHGFDVVQIGNYIDFGVEATVIYYRTGAEKVARALQSEIFPGARLEASSTLKNGVDLKVLLGSDLLVQPRIMARLLGEELAATPPPIKAPTPEPGPPPRPAAPKETAAPVIVSAPATAEPIPAAAAPKSGASQRRIVLAAAERADTGIEIRNGTRTQNLAHLTRTLLSQQGFDVVQIGNYIDFGVEATVIYYRTGAEKAARALQSEIFPGARIEASSSLKNGTDIKVLLGHDLEVQPRIMARLLGEEMTAPPPAVKAPTPESGPPPRSTPAKETAAPVIGRTPATAGPACPPGPALPPVPAAASVAKSETGPRHPDHGGVSAAAARTDSSIEVKNGTGTPNLAHLTQTLLSQHDFNVIRIGDYFDSGVTATVIYYRTAAEKVARALQSEIFPGARIEARSRLKGGTDIKVLLGSDLLAQPLMLARLHAEDTAAPPSAVDAVTPESGPPSGSTPAKETTAPAIVRAPATAEPSQPPSQAPPSVPEAATPETGASLRRAVLAAAERADSGIEVRKSTRTQTPLLARPDFNVAQVGNQIDFGVADPALYCRTAAEKVARALQSEIFPGARIEARSRLHDQMDLKLLLGSDLLAQPLMLARLHAEETAAPPSAVEAPTPESGPPSGSTPAKETTAPAIVRVQATAEPSQPPSQTPPPVPEATSAANSGAIQLHTNSEGELHIGNVASSLPTPNLPDIPNSFPEVMMVEPRRGWSRHLRLLGQIEETSAPKADLDAIQKACQGLALGEGQVHEFDGIINAAGQAAAEKEVAEVEAQHNYLPVKPVSQDQQVIPAPASQPAAPQTTEAAAAGDIQRYRDAEGVLHIGNVVPSQPTPSPQTPSPLESPSAVSEAMLAEPRRSGTRHARLVGQTEETYTPESDLDAIQKACQGLVRGEAEAHEFEGVIAAAGQAVAGKEAAEAAEAAEVAVDYNYLPVRQSSPDQGIIPAPAPQPAAPPTAAAAAAGDIQRYRDARGVLHFSNAPPRAEDLGPAVQLAQRPNSPGGEARQLDQPEAPPLRLPFRQAAWSPEDRRLATLPTTSAPVQPAASSEPGLIRHYRDSKGVLHISNTAPEPREAPQPAGLMAWRRDDAGYDPLPRRPAPAAAEGEGGLAWRPAAWNGEGGIKPLKPVKTAPSQPVEVTTEGGIRRFRDAKGITHIKTVEYPLPPGVVLPPRQADPYLMAPRAAVPAAPHARTRRRAG